MDSSCISRDLKENSWLQVSVSKIYIFSIHPGFHMEMIWFSENLSMRERSSVDDGEKCNVWKGMQPRVFFLSNIEEVTRNLGKILYIRHLSAPTGYYYCTVC